jgi:hypothetical protein
LIEQTDSSCLLYGLLIVSRKRKLENRVVAISGPHPSGGGFFTGLPDSIFAYPKYQFEYILDGLRMENVAIGCL